MIGVDAKALTDALARAESAESKLRAVEWNAHANEPEAQTIRELNTSVRVLRDEVHEQRIRAQAAESLAAERLEVLREVDETLRARQFDGASPGTITDLRGRLARAIRGTDAAKEGA